MRTPGHFFCDDCNDVVFGRTCQACGKCARFVPDTNYREVSAGLTEQREAAVIEALNDPPAVTPVSAERAKVLFAQVKAAIGQK